MKTLEASARRIRITMPRLRGVPSSLMIHPEDYTVQMRLINNEFLKAAALGKVNEADRLLSSMDAVPDAVDMDLNTAMHHVAVRGFTEMGSRLLDNWKAVINPLNRFNFTPLDLSSAAGKTATVKMLLVRYPNSGTMNAQFLKAAKVADDYGQAAIAAILRRTAKEGVGFLNMGAQVPARTASLV
jgi:ankyrin repeat protein